MVPQPVEVDPVHHLAQPQVDDPQDHLHHLLLPLSRHVLIRSARLHHQEDDRGLESSQRYPIFLEKTVPSDTQASFISVIRTSAYVHNLPYLTLKDTINY